MASFRSEKLERVRNQDLNIPASLTLLRKKRYQDLPDSSSFYGAHRSVLVYFDFSSATLIFRQFSRVSRGVRIRIIRISFRSWPVLVGRRVSVSVRWCDRLVV